MTTLAAVNNTVKYGTLNTSRLIRMVNCTNKADALKMGWLDRFKELFRGDDKKL